MEDWFGVDVTISVLGSSKAGCNGMNLASMCVSMSLWTWFGIVRSFHMGYYIIFDIIIFDIIIGFS